MIFGLQNAVYDSLLNSLKLGTSDHYPDKIITRTFYCGQVVIREPGKAGS